MRVLQDYAGLLAGFELLLRIGGVEKNEYIYLEMKPLLSIFSMATSYLPHNLILRLFTHAI